MWPLRNGYYQDLAFPPEGAKVAPSLGARLFRQQTLRSTMTTRVQVDFRVWQTPVCTLISTDCVHRSTRAAIGIRGQRLPEVPLRTCRPAALLRRRYSVCLGFEIARGMFEIGEQPGQLRLPPQPFLS